MAEYRFLTTWLVESPIEPVWDAIYDTERWPSWWKGVERVQELEPGQEDGVGKLFSIVWKSFLPYELDFETRVTRVEKPNLMTGEASGELTGTGTWRLFESQGATAVLYEWNVATTRAWMNTLAPLLRPVFEWNHDYVMKAGGEGLGRLLGRPLIAKG